MTKTQFIIKSFHPLDVTLPDQDMVEGIVQIVLPEIHIQIYDLSMGTSVLKGAHLGADVALNCVRLDFPEPVEASKVMAFIIASREDLEKLWRAIQAEYDKKGALL